MIEMTGLGVELESSIIWTQKLGICSLQRFAVESKEEAEILLSTMIAAQFADLMAVSIMPPDDGHSWRVYLTWRPLSTLSTPQAQIVEQLREKLPKKVFDSVDPVEIAEFCLRDVPGVGKGG